MADDIQSFLFEADLFSELDGEELQKIADLAEAKTREGGTYLFREGDEAESLYVIKEGLVEIQIDSGSGEDPTPITTLGPQEVLGELSLYGNPTRSASAYIPEGTETTLLELDQGKLKELLEANGDLGVKVLTKIVQNISRRLRQLDRSHEVIFQALQEK